MLQASPPKFMYAKGELLRRREAVGIHVSYSPIMIPLLGAERRPGDYVVTACGVPQRRAGDSQIQYLCSATPAEDALWSFGLYTRGPR